MSLSTVKILTPPRSSSLISLAQVKLYQGVTTSEKDALFSHLILDASSAMIQFLGTHPGRIRYQEKSRGEGGYRRYLSKIPVEEGTLSVKLNGEQLVENPDGLDGFALEDPATGIVFHSSTWTSYSSPVFGGLNIEDTYIAGFLFPDQVSDWTASTDYAVGSFVRPSSLSLLRFECTSAGTSGSSEPAWPETIGITISDGSVTWTVRKPLELPAHVSSWCYSEVLRLLSDLDWEPGLISRSVEGVSESRFARTLDAGQLSPITTSGLQSWKRELGMIGIA